MATLDMTAFSNATNKLYPGKLEKVWYKDCPMLAWLPKTYAFEGQSRSVRPLYAGTTGGSTFAQALAVQGTPSVEEFVVTRKKNFVIGSVDNEAIMATRSQRGASAQALKTSIDGSLYEFGRSLATQVWGLGGGSRGVIATSGITTTALTLDVIQDAVNFEVGMQVTTSTANGTSGSVNPGFVTLTKVNRRTGVLTADQNWTTGIPAAADDDFLFRKSDFGAVLSGVQAWCPPSDPGATTFFGVNRSVDTVRLGGNRITGASTIEETVFDAQAEVSQNGGRADTLWMHPQRFSEMCKSMQAKAQYLAERGKVMSTGKVPVGFDGFVFPGPSGPVTVVADPSCPYGTGLLTRKEAWELAGLGQIPHFDRADGQQFTRNSTSDGIQYRLKFYGNLLCLRLIDVCNITWA